MLEILFVFMIVPVAFFIATLLHELSHAIVVLIQGGKITKFVVKPFYSRDEEKTIFGQVKYRGYINKRIVCIAPLIKNVIIIVLSIVITVKLDSFFKIFFLELAVFEFLEVYSWIFEYIDGKEGSDGGDFRLIGERNGK